MNTAIEAIKKVIPNAVVSNTCHDDYPIKVTVSAVTSTDERVVVWTGSQRDLFRKYNQARTQSINEIVKNIQDLFDVTSVQKIDS